MSGKPPLKSRLIQGDVLLGTWIKTPSPMICEVLARTELDLLCLDAEHAPFDRQALDQCLGFLHTIGFPALVRVPSCAPEHTLNALDCGANGVLVPHVLNVEGAEACVRQAHYGPGGRGFAGSSRAAHYTGRAMAEHLARSAEDTVLFAQIEDVDAIDQLEAIAAVDGIDCLFVGRADLTVALREHSPKAPSVIAAVERVCAAGGAVGRPVGMFLSDLAELPHWIERGATVFILSSDHGAMLSGVAELVSRFREGLGLKH